MNAAVALAAPPAGPSTPPPPWVRTAVRDVLERTPQYQGLSPQDQQKLARAMVKVSALAADLIAEEHDAHQEVQRQSAPGQVLARAQDAQPAFGESANRIAGTTQSVLNAVSFPRFVTDLINGVFRAMLDSNSQQMQQYVQLINAVSSSAEGFERTQFGLAQVRQWVADHFPEAIEYDAPDPGDTPDPEEQAQVRLRLRANATMPNAEDIRATLGMEPGESVDASNPEQLVPLARRYLARQRQQMLATMVAMGMQRIVIDSGKINAAMRFHIDTRSAASEDRGSQFNMQNRVRASGSFGMGPWGASAEIENNIGYVSTERSQRTEEINTDLELTSSVELNFRSDYLPLNQMAAQAQADRIRNATINPSADIPDPSAARNARLATQVGAERERQTAMNTAIDTGARVPAPTPAPPAPAPAARPPVPSTAHPPTSGAAPTTGGPPSSGAAPTTGAPTASGAAPTTGAPTTSGAAPTTGAPTTSGAAPPPSTSGSHGPPPPAARPPAPPART